VAAASVEDGVFHAVADDDEVDSFGESADRLSIWEFVSGGDTGWLHSSSSVCDGSMVSQNWMWWGELVHEARAGEVAFLTDLRGGADRGRTMSETREPIDDVIRAAGLRRTTPRALVLQMLRATRGHMTASAIFEQIEAESSEEPIAPSTVYRALEALEAKGVVSALRSRSAETRYEWAPERPGHHHLLCNACGAVMELDLDTVRELAAEIEERTGFQPEIRHLAIDGLCSDCRPEGEAEAKRLA
jgi:Fur family ferric uptake transcriptional regulator